MPIRPNNIKLNATTVDILNAIRNNASANYRDYIPTAENNPDSVREIGAILMDYPVLQNEFVSALVNRIGLVLLESKTYQNPWSVFKRGRLEMGESVEVIFTNIAKAHDYTTEEPDASPFERNIPDIRAAFAFLNYQKYYPQTVQEEDLKLAFLSWDGVSSLIADIVNSMYTADQTDEFLVMKYMLAKALLAGRIKAVEISTNDIKGTIATIKSTSNKFIFQNTKFNPAGVVTNTVKEQQYIIVNSDFDATMDVEVLAAAFNMDKAEFMGHRVLVDGFGEFDDKRLSDLFKDDPNFTPLTAEEKAALNLIPAVLLAEDWFLIFDKVFKFTEQYNSRRLYWNYYLHVWKVLGISPFAQAASFVPGAPTVESVTVSPAAATMYPGMSITLSVEVATDNFASKEVIWKSNTEGVTVNHLGVVTVAPDFERGAEATTVTITATSAFNDAISGSATITIPAAD